MGLNFTFVTLKRHNLSWFLVFCGIIHVPKSVYGSDLKRVSKKVITGAFSRRVSSWLMDVICGLSFRQWTKLCWHHWVNIFEQLFWMAESCIEVRFTQLWDIAIFKHKHFTQGSVATRLRCGRIFNYWFARNLLLSLSVKELLQSELAFGKVRDKSRMASFYGYGVH